MALLHEFTDPIRLPLLVTALLQEFTEPIDQGVHVVAPLSARVWETLAPQGGQASD